MCFGGSIPKDTTAADIERREEERQAKVTAGREGIDTAFGRFDDQFFNTFKDARQGFYAPQIAKEFTDTQAKLIAALQGRGVLASTVGANALGNLTQKRGEAEVGIANETQDEANRLRGTVQSAKTNLYGLNEASADPESINAQALGTASSIVAPQAFSPLGQIFSSALQPFINFNNARQNRPGVPVTASSLASGSGSGRVVN